jgi:hypothetical protein
MMLKPHFIKDTLIGLEETWFPDELATLYSNSRTEMNIRDKFNMHFAKKLQGSDSFFIQREWSRTGITTRADLAIIQYRDTETKPVALFEFKARHTFFICDNEPGKRNGDSGYYKTFYGDGGNRNGVLQDINKHAFWTGQVPCYNVLIGVHPLYPIPQMYDVFGNDCKEINPINKSFKKFGNSDQIKEL